MPNFERLLEANQAAGWPEPTERELAEADRTGSALCDVLAFEFSQPGLLGDSDTFLDALAIEAITAWNNERRTREMYDPNGNYSPLGVFRAGLQPSLDNPATMTKPLCIVASHPSRAYPLDYPYDLEVEELMNTGRFNGTFRCDAQISANCQGPAKMIWRVKYGEFIVLPKFCNPCNTWLYLHSERCVKCLQAQLVLHGYRLKPGAPADFVQPTSRGRSRQLEKIYAAHRGYRPGAAV